MLGIIRSKVLIAARHTCHINRRSVSNHSTEIACHTHVGLMTGPEDCIACVLGRDPQYSVEKHISHAAPHGLTISLSHDIE